MASCEDFVSGMNIFYVFRKCWRLVLVTALYYSHGPAPAISHSLQPDNKLLSIRSRSSDLCRPPESPGTGNVVRTELCQNILMRNNYPAVIFTILMEKAIKIIPRVPEAPIFISTKSNNSRSFFLRSRPA